MAGSSSASYIHMVQHMIEKCLIFHMSKEECELEKENKEFFKAYEERQSKQEQMSEEETNQMIQKIISDSPKESDD
ncbi:hypothetical protein HID58_082272 [Brassica napus]|uniref:Uncharacterized protein n=1 Tax=Brassica napus TaxID=3708 RepID=A0ABQ7YCW1_BRANA|nr:hypothetical protein HID58_082272 [Brassica napus]